MVLITAVLTSQFMLEDACFASDTGEHQYDSFLVCKCCGHKLIANDEEESYGLYA